MRTTFFALAIFVAAPIFMNASCQKAVSNNNGGNTDRCNPNVACTMIFAMVTTQVIDGNGDAVRLDDYYTLRTSTGEKIKSQETMEGYYTILDDSYLNKLKQSSDKFQFVGMKNGKQVVNETYTITADCCHVQKKEGRPTIVAKD
jgi:hypothetical protein